ncbi:unnamed protein product [Euphydryas editha]|uniref:Uncharacterized protein n=1 Tax=Euphydryas editha TaxID=104508 RepID=A0AAU9VGJ1_EUPED|nr:unnamed protein product [Euphydryas editha]
MKQWIKAIFTVALSEKTGPLPSGEESPCSLSKSFLRKGITGSSYNEMATNIEQQDNIQNEKDDLSSEDESDDDFNNYEDKTSNNNAVEMSWTAWGTKIIDEAKKDLNDNGTEANAYYNKVIAKRLQHDLKRIVLWSCIAQKKFKRGRIPASSASVESEFKRIKQGTCKKKRVDEVTEVLIQYIQGTTKIVDAGTQNDNACNESVPDSAFDSIFQILVAAACD